MKQNHGEAPASPVQMPTQEQLDEILQFDTCAISNAIEYFGVRLRNEGFTCPGLSCMTGADERILGYAATFRVRSTDPPVIGGRFADRTDWWSTIESLPRPRIAVFENINGEPGGGACTGEVHVAMLKAFGCKGLITDGMVRDLPGIRKLGLPVFAKSLTVSHSYLHIVDFGTPVEIMGLEVHSGDLLYADCHGVLNIPIEIVAELPAVAERILRENKAIIEVCQSPDFSPAKLLNALNKRNALDPTS
jgi:4-hydroxy-4-methyl-2-oxoglutarate aldolase